MTILDLIFSKPTPISDLPGRYRGQFTPSAKTRRERSRAAGLDAQLIACSANLSDEQRRAAVERAKCGAVRASVGRGA